MRVVIHGHNVIERVLTITITDMVQYWLDVVTSLSELITFGKQRAFGEHNRPTGNAADRLRRDLPPGYRDGK